MEALWGLFYGFSFVRTYQITENATMLSEDQTKQANSLNMY